MVKNGYITEEEMEEAYNTELTYVGVKIVITYLQLCIIKMLL